MSEAHYCHGDECTATMPADGEVVGWTVWRSEHRTSLLCPACTQWSRAESCPDRGVGYEGPHGLGCDH